MMKERRQVGFIKTFSSKQISYHHDEPSEFSYFKIKATREEDQFSPYRLSNQANSPREVLAKPPLPKNKIADPPRKYRTQKVITDTKVQNITKEQAKTILQRAKQNVLVFEENKKHSRQKLQKNIGSIRSKIDQLDEQLKHLKISKQKKQRQSQQKLRQINKQKPKFELEQQQKSCSSSQEQNQEQNPIQYISSHKLKNSQPVSTKQYRYNYHIDFNSTKKPSQSTKLLYEQIQSPKIFQKQNFITFNSRTTNKPPLVIKQYSSESSDEEEEEQQHHYLPQRKQQTQKQIEKEYEITDVKGKTQVFKNKGGVCFDIDVKQFNQPIIKSNRQERPTKPQKLQKIDKKAQILRRREQAKLYDKIARKNVFK